jgi:serine/threonine protein kinase
VQSGKDVNLVGRTLSGRYHVQELIGSGPNGRVYRAEDTARQYGVALKVLNETVSDEKSRERYKNGVEAASTLAHPNIVRLYSFNLTDDKKPFLVMDCVQGQNLGQLLSERGRLPEDLAIAIFVQVCDALEHAHAKGVVHRNLKPSNIILISAPGDSFMVKISDFGLAKLRGQKETRQSLAKKGEILGNPLYMSPEQCRGQQIDERTDIYAAGCLLYECLTGNAPFGGANSFEIMSKHVNSQFPDLAGRCGDLPHAGQLSSILQRALAKNVNERYQSAGEMSHDMNLISEAAVPEWNERAVCMKPAVVRARPQVAGESSTLLSFDILKPVLLACAALLVFLLAAGGGLVALAITDADVKPLIRYKIAVQEVILPANDQRLIRNLNYMTDYLKQRGEYADAWKYKEKVLRAVQPAAAQTH